MSKRWIQNSNRCTEEYLDGIEDFIEFARTHNPGATRIRCPYHASSSNATRVDNVEPIVDPNDQVMDIIHYVFLFASTNINQQGEDEVHTPIDSAEFE
ncbi:hypothetical protein L3X38_022854 [Prunus dulcis]|uniref:Transposase-associated domain-containing protein n=1 Tax=Prunus dulcis TaxID=3755 RepID=A0AAD4Z4Q2_PRUDU|nr:hypothetical protein L3X38_022854 [Prunus dulcis]